MKNLKVGIFLMVLGSLLNLAYTAFSGNETSSFGDFSSGLLIGLSIGCSLVGIILMVSYMAKNKEKNKK